MKRLLIAIAILLAGCGYEPWPEPGPPNPVFLDDVLTRTPTTAPATATVEATPTARPMPTPWADPVCMEPIPTPGMHIYLVLGMDWQPGRVATLTDTIMLVAVDPEASYVSLISIPRDFFAADRFLRMNAIYILRGSEALMDSIGCNFGIRPEGYAGIYPQGFIQLVDRLGGIDITPVVRLEERCYAEDFILEAGVTYHLDGPHALCFARNRGTSNDFSRMARQQIVLRALADALMQRHPDWSVPEVMGGLVDFYTQYVHTDLNLSVGGVALRTWYLAPDHEVDIRHFVIGTELVQPGVPAELDCPSCLVPIDQGDLRQAIVETLAE